MYIDKHLGYSIYHGLSNANYADHYREADTMLIAISTSQVTKMHFFAHFRLSSVATNCR